MASEVRFTEHHVCLPLRQPDGTITNVVKRRVDNDDKCKVTGLKDCGTRGSFGDPRQLEKTRGPVVVVEGVFDWLSARVLAPGRLVLGAHGASRLPDVVRMVADKCRERGLVFVPHKDKSQVGERQVQKAIAVARQLGVPDARIRILDIGQGDLNDFLVTGGGGDGNPFDAAPTLADLDEHRCFPLTDAGNAARFAHVHRHHFRYVYEHGRWLHWVRKSWDCAHEKVHLARAAIEVSESVARDAVITETRDAAMAARLREHAHKMQSEARLSAMVSLARAMPELLVDQDELDRDPFLLAADNGTIDLRTGELRPHRREDLITSRSPIAYDPDAGCPRWERFLAEVFEPNPDVIQFVQRFAGYSLTGETSAQCLLFAHGSGANGKGVLFRQLEKLLGPQLATPAPFDAFVEKRHGDAPLYALADFHGKRSVFVSEGNQYDRLAEGLIKQVTGGDVISARFPHGRFFKYRPTFKLWMSSNHLPKIRGNDHGMWRRFKLTPFRVSFKDQRDDQLEGQLDKEMPGIFAWAVRGCLDWLHDGGGIKGLGDSKSVADATEEYRSASDHVGRFIVDCCVTSVEGARAKTTTVYQAYRQWAEGEGLRPLSNSLFGQELKRSGFEPQKGHRARFYPLGLAAQRGEESD